MNAANEGSCPTVCSASVEQMMMECRRNGSGYSDACDADPRVMLEKLAWKDAATALRRVIDCVRRAEKHRKSYIPNYTLDTLSQK